MELLVPWLKYGLSDMGFWTNSRSSGTFSDIGFFNHLNNFKLLTLHYIYEVMEWLLLPSLKTRYCSTAVYAKCLYWPCKGEPSKRNHLPIQWLHDEMYNIIVISFLLIILIIFLVPLICLSRGSIKCPTNLAFNNIFFFLAAGVNSSYGSSS